MADNPAGAKLGAASFRCRSYTCLVCPPGMRCGFALSEWWHPSSAFITCRQSVHGWTNVSCGLYRDGILPLRLWRSLWRSQELARDCCCLRLWMPLVRLGRGLPFDPRSNPRRIERLNPSATTHPAPPIHIARAHPLASKSSLACSTGNTLSRGFSRHCFSRALCGETLPGSPRRPCRRRPRPSRPRRGR